MSDECWAVPGMIVRCVDARVRKSPPGAIYSDFEKKLVGIIEVMEILTVREVFRAWQFGDAWAVRFKEIERPLEGIRRYRAVKVYEIDRPFFLDRFVKIKSDDDIDSVMHPKPADAVPA